VNCDCDKHDGRHGQCINCSCKTGDAAVYYDTDAPTFIALAALAVVLVPLVFAVFIILS